MPGATLVVPSRLVAADLMAIGVRRARITIVPGGADHLPAPDRRGDRRRCCAGLGVAGEFLLTVGTLEPRKNLDRLVQASAGRAGSLPEPWPLVIVGPDGWGPEPAAPAPADGVVFTGAVSDPVLAALYRRARAFAYVPLTEGYGLPPLEAMRAGTPAVVSDRGPERARPRCGGAGPARIVDPLDVDDIAGGLAAVLTDDTLRADLARAGRRRTPSPRTWRDAARAHLDLWRSLP